MHAKPCTILLVDDDRLVLTTLANGLINAGYTVCTAESVDEAETFLGQTQTPPTLVILDVRMPGRSGLELAAWLQTSSDIPFMFLTAYSDQEIVHMATAYGAFGYLVKPIDTPQLLPAIEAAMARAKDAKELRVNSLQLQNALNGERDINVAVGITMVQQQKSRTDAFELLRKTARDQRSKLAELASQLIAATETMLKIRQ